MGTDANIHFSTKEKLTEEHLSEMDSQFTHTFLNKDHSPIQYQEHESYGRLYQYEPEQKHIYSLPISLRYAIDSICAQNWVIIHNYIKFLQSHPWVETVYYGPDTADILCEISEEVIQETWSAIASDFSEEWEDNHARRIKSR